MMSSDVTAAVVEEIDTRLMGLQEKYLRERILIHKMDVKSAFRQVPVDPTGAPART